MMQLTLLPVSFSPEGRGGTLLRQMHISCVGETFNITDKVEDPFLRTSDKAFPIAHGKDLETALKHFIIFADRLLEQ